MGTEVLVDTNIWLLTALRRLPLRDEVSRLVPDGALRVPRVVIRELERLVVRGTAGAPVALQIVRQYPVVPTPGAGDAAIIRRAIGKGAWVVTADKQLALRLREHGCGVLMPRGMHGLARFLPRSFRPTPSSRRLRGNRYERRSGRRPIRRAAADVRR